MHHFCTCQEDIFSWVAPIEVLMLLFLLPFNPHSVNVHILLSRQFTSSHLTTFHALFALHNSIVHAYCLIPFSKCHCLVSHSLLSVDCYHVGVLMCLWLCCTHLRLTCRFRICTCTIIHFRSWSGDYLQPFANTDSLPFVSLPKRVKHSLRFCTCCHCLV